MKELIGFSEPVQITIIITTSIIICIMIWAVTKILE